MPKSKPPNPRPVATNRTRANPVACKIANLKAGGLSADEAEIIRILEPVLLPTTLNGKPNILAASAAAGIDALCQAKMEVQNKDPSKGKSKTGTANSTLETAFREVEAKAVNHDIEGFLTDVWELLINLVNAIPHDHPAQDSVVAVLEELSLRDTAEVYIRGVSALSLSLLLPLP